MSETVEVTEDGIAVDPDTGEVVHEPESDGTETPAEPENATAAETENTVEEEAMRAKMIDKGLEKEHARHERALKALYGELWEERVMCPLCIGEGFLMPWQPGELPPEQIEAIDALSGRFASPTYVEDTDYTMCDHCAGQGHTLTGSKNPEHITKLCDKCVGNGFVKATPQFVLVPPIPLPGSPDALNAQAPVSYGAPGVPDAWGRPVGHVHYGIEPQFVTG